MAVPNGFNKRVAPVLPAMGLHSFHNDSYVSFPRFAGLLYEPQHALADSVARHSQVLPPSSLIPNLSPLTLPSTPYTQLQKRPYHIRLQAVNPSPARVRRLTQSLVLLGQTESPRSTHHPSRKPVGPSAEQGTSAFSPPRMSTCPSRARSGSCPATSLAIRTRTLPSPYRETPLHRCRVMDWIHPP